jgi:hypothetical protein
MTILPSSSQSIPSFFKTAAPLTCQHIYILWRLLSLYRCSCLYTGVTVFSELLMFIQCMLIEMNVRQQSIMVKYRRGVGWRRADVCKHFFKLCVISGFRCDRNGICALLGCYVAYSQAQEQALELDCTLEDETGRLSQNIAYTITALRCITSQKRADLSISLGFVNDHPRVSPWYYQHTKYRTRPPVSKSLHTQNKVI